MFTNIRRYSYPVRTVSEKESVSLNSTKKKEEDLSNIKKEEEVLNSKKTNSDILEENQNTMKFLEVLINEKFEKLEKSLLEQKTPYENLENNLNEIKSLNIELVGRKRRKDEEKSSNLNKNECEKVFKIPIEKKEKKTKKIKVEDKSADNELPGVIKLDGDSISSVN